MKLDIVGTSRFKKDYKLAVKRDLSIELFDNIIRILAAGKPLPEQNRDHQLSGNWRGHRECHIQPDRLLVYKIDRGALVLALARTGSHADLLDM